MKDDGLGNSFPPKLSLCRIYARGTVSRDGFRRDGFRLAAAKSAEVAPVLRQRTERDYIGNAFDEVDPYRGGCIMQLDIRPSVAQLLHGVIILRSAGSSLRVGHSVRQS